MMFNTNSIRRSVLASFYFGNISYPSKDPPRVGFLSTVPSDAGDQLKAAVAEASSASANFPGECLASFSSLPLLSSSASSASPLSLSSVLCLLYFFFAFSFCDDLVLTLFFSRVPAKTDPAPSTLPTGASVATGAGGVPMAQVSSTTTSSGEEGKVKTSGGSSGRTRVSVGMVTAVGWVVGLGSGLLRTV
jgi:hypothetical protein